MHRNDTQIQVRSVLPALLNEHSTDLRMKAVTGTGLVFAVFLCAAVLARLRNEAISTVQRAYVLLRVSYESSFEQFFSLLVFQGVQCENAF